MALKSPLLLVITAGASLLLLYVVLTSPNGYLLSKTSAQRERGGHNVRTPNAPPSPSIKPTLATPEKNQSYPCRTLFSINSGRSGSGFLAKVLSLLKNVKASHEEYSVGLKIAAQIYKEGFKSSYQGRKQKKIATINRSLAAGNCYAESSHLFIKTFQDVVVNELADNKKCRVDIVVLRRYLPVVVASMIRNRWEDWPKDHWGYDRPNAITLLEKPIGMNETRREQDYAGAIYYTLDIEAQAQRFLDMYKDHPQIFLHEWNLEALATPSGIQRFAASMGFQLKPNVNLEEISCTIVNPKKKNHQVQEEDEAMVHILRYLELAQEQGIVIPELPQLTKFVPDFQCP